MKKPRNAKTNITYRTYISMKQRCYNSNMAMYHRYGGRGIRVCDSWLENYDNFLDDLGEKPEGYEIDRIDPNGNYEPLNCRWVPRIVNLKNKIKPSVYILHDTVRKKYNASKSGVYFEITRGKWRARASIKGKQKHIGYFNLESEAREALKEYIISI